MGFDRHGCRPYGLLVCRHARDRRARAYRSAGTQHRRDTTMTAKDYRLIADGIHNAAKQLKSLGADEHRTESETAQLISLAFEPFLLSDNAEFRIERLMTRAVLGNGA